MVRKIMNLVCSRHGFTLADMTAKKQRRQLMAAVAAKQETAYLLRSYTELSLLEIAQLMGYPDKQIILHAIKALEKVAAGNRHYRMELDQVEASLSGYRVIVPTVNSQAPAATDAPQAKKKRPGMTYLKNSAGQFYTLDENRRLTLTDIPGPLRHIQQGTRPGEPLTCTGDAAKVLRLICNRYGCYHADCVLFIDCSEISLDFSKAVDKFDTYTIPGTLLQPIQVPANTTIPVSNPFSLRGIAASIL